MAKKSHHNDIGLRLLNKLFGLQYLHYGYFDGVEPTMANLPQAQEAWVQVLLSHIPAGTKDIYDVGCGVGGIAKQLVDRGYNVTCVDPDPYMIEQTQIRTNHKIASRVGYYEKIPDLPANVADLVLMPESCQYISPIEGFEQTKRILRDGGYFLTADFFKIRDLDQPYLSKSGHRFEEFIETGRKAGFELVTTKDITRETAPTMDIYQKLILEKVLPVIEGVFEFASRVVPWLYKILRFFLSKKVLHLKKKYENQDAEIFIRYKKYYVLLFKKVAKP